MDFLSLESRSDLVKRKNFFLLSGVFGFIWLIFHFTIVFFFAMTLKSVMLVWLFLGIGNFVALILDIPIWSIQKFFKTKSLFLLAAFLMIVEWLIFLKFILAYNIWTVSTSIDTIETITSGFNWFINDGINWILLIGSWILYWVIKETFDVTALSYIMNNADPSEYANILSKYYINVWGGAMVGLVVAWVILSFQPIVAVLLFMLGIIFYMAFLVLFFENPDYTIDINTVKNFKHIYIKRKNEKYKKFEVEEISREDVENAPKGKFLFFNPPQLKKKDIEEMLKSAVEAYKSVFKVFILHPLMPLIWVSIVIMALGFRDTFIATFQVEFLEKILAMNQGSIIVSNQFTGKIISGYLLLWLLVLPAFATQFFFIKMSKKTGITNMISFGILLSAFSIICFALSNNILLVILFGIMNSLWYAATMPLSQAAFSEWYNKHYASINNLSSVDAHSSAAPLKMIGNLANVFGVVGWGIIVGIFSFKWFFLVFGSFMMLLLAFTLLFRNKLEI